MLKKLFRILITAAAILFLIWFIAPFIRFGILNPGNMLGILICLFLIFRFGSARMYNSVKEFFYRNKLSKILWKIFTVLISAFAVYAVTISGLIAIFSMRAPASDSSPTAIVLGAEVKPWGASALLQQRINAAENYLNEHPDAYAVATGGQGTDEPMSEAQCIYDNLVKSGISGNRIFIEDQATNTRENISFSNKIISENNIISSPDKAVVTDSYHQFRARIIARRLGVTGEIYAVNTDNGLTGLICYPTMFVREWIAIPAEFIR